MVILYLSVQFYKSYIPSGILWNNGISSSDVMLVSKENSQFHHYLYEKNNELKGVITLQKKGSFWSLYYHGTGFYLQEESPDVELVKTFYGSYKDNSPTHIPVWGGLVNIGDENSFSIRSKNKVHSPNLAAEVDGKIYFFFSSPEITGEDTIEVTKP